MYILKQEVITVVYIYVQVKWYGFFFNKEKHYHRILIRIWWTGLFWWKDLKDHYVDL